LALAFERSLLSSTDTGPATGLLLLLLLLLLLVVVLLLLLLL
jgi:hypothetical protein